ncbi:MAG: hypothetical protein RIE32_04055 [Phycisphaerales bacterium]
MRRALVVVACVGLASTLCAQDGEGSAASDRIAELQAQVDALSAERDALRDQLDQMRAQFDEMRVRLGEAIEMLRNLGYAPPAPVLAEPADPMASPLAAMQTLRRRARLELASMPRAREDDRAAYRQAARDWVDTMNRVLDGEKDWLVRVLAVDLPASGSSAARATASLQLYDAATGAPLSPPMEVSVPGRVGRRMAAAGADQGWMARVHLRPAVRFNPDRLERGPFDHPPFLAPQVEAEIGVDWLRFEPADVPEGFFPDLPGDDPLAVPDRSGPAAPAQSPGDTPARQPR